MKLCTSPPLLCCRYSLKFDRCNSVKFTELFLLFDILKPGQLTSQLWFSKRAIPLALLNAAQLN